MADLFLPPPEAPVLPESIVAAPNSVQSVNGRDGSCHVVTGAKLRASC